MSVQKINLIKTCLLFMFLIFSSRVYADLEITHIMYNPEGADDGYEYVVIQNTSDRSINVSNYFFLENDTYHGLYPESESLAAGDEAWVVKDIPTARIRYGEQTYVKSSFSLNNTGEFLAFTNSDRVSVAEFTYTSDMGGNEDGSALSVSGSGTGVYSEGTDVDSDTDSDTHTSSTTSSSSKAPIIYEPYYKAYINVPDSIVATDDFILQAGVFYHTGPKKVHKKGGHYYINFGNGYAQEYPEYIDMTYNYPSPGKYLITLEYYTSQLAKENAEPDAFIQKEIQVIEPRISILEYDGFKGITLHNESNRIDLEGWHLISGSDVYTFPKYSTIGSKQDLVVAREYLGFHIPIARTIKLLNSDYLTIDEYNPYEPAAIITEGASPVSLDTGDIPWGIEIGSDTLIEGGIDTIPSPTAIMFREDSLNTLNSTEENKSASSYYIWWLAAGIIALAFLKSIIGKPKKPTTPSPEPVYSIELIE